MVKLPVEGVTRNDEGLTEKREIQERVYLAGAITKVHADYATASIVNTTSEAVEIDEPVLTVTEVEPGALTGAREEDSERHYVDRPGEVLKRLRLEHLNEARREILRTCSDYQVFFTYHGTR
jgi:riboflavin biosynthesis pyrimidine reductase